MNVTYELYGAIMEVLKIQGVEHLAPTTRTITDQDRFKAISADWIAAWNEHGTPCDDWDEINYAVIKVAGQNNIVAYERFNTIGVGYFDRKKSYLAIDVKGRLVSISNDFLNAQYAFKLGFNLTSSILVSDEEYLYNSLDRVCSFPKDTYIVQLEGNSLSILINPVDCEVKLID